jgi:uncharacterized membrane protein YdfJ with MMPL/SSD domain
MKALTAFGTRAPRRTLTAALIVGVLATLVSSGIGNSFVPSEDEFFSPGTESYRAGQMLHTAVGAKAFPNLALILPARQLAGLRQVQIFGHSSLSSSRNKSYILKTFQKLASFLPRLFYSRNRQLVALVGYFHHGVSAGPSAAWLAQRFRSRPNVIVGGSALVDQQFIEQTNRDLIKAELIAFPLILLLTLMVFRSVAAAMLPVFAGGLALSATLLGLRAINIVYPVSIFAIAIATGIAVGLSLDYSLLLVSRYREELARGLDAHQAVLATVSSAGRTVAISSMTVAAAFTSLLVFPLGLLHSFAIGGISAAIFAGLVSLAVLPAILVLLGHRVNALAPRRWRRSAERAARPAKRGVWYRLARIVMAHPVAVAFAVSCALLAMGAPALGARLTGFDAIALPASASSHRFEERMKADFAHPLYDEVVVVAHGSESLIETILAQHMEKLSDVAAGELDYINGDSWMFSITTRSAPFSNASTHLVREIRALPHHLAVTGSTADYLDTAASLRAHLPEAMAVLVATTLVLLFIATGSVILPLKAVVMNMLSLLAAFGLLVFVFQDGRLQGLLEYHGVGAVVLTQPILIGVGTFGILTDYGVFLLLRIKEGWDSGLSNDEAVASGLERSGRIITAAALLFCVAVGALITARLAFVKEAAFGITVAVAIDATIIRALLVPSLMTLLGRWNWWRPRGLSWSALGTNGRRGHVVGEMGDGSASEPDPL